MQKQPVDLAISTTDMIAGLDLPADEPKCTFRDLMTSTGQIGTALSLCWILHSLV